MLVVRRRLLTRYPKDGRNDSVELSDRVVDALRFALHQHGAQRRKLGGAPYVSHLLRVAGTVLQYGGDEDETIAALLHDVVEDQGGPAALAEIRRRFGPRVAQVVDGCTDSHQHPKPPWRTRKEQYLQRLQSASASVRLIAAADKLDNVRDLLAHHRVLGDEIWQHFHGGRDGSVWYHRSVVDILRSANDDPRRLPLIEQLQQAVSELEHLAGRSAG